MKLQKPIDMDYSTKMKYQPVLEALKELPAGMALPITLEDGESYNTISIGIRFATKGKVIIRKDKSDEKKLYVWNFSANGNQ